MGASVNGYLGICIEAVTASIAFGVQVALKYRHVVGKLNRNFEGDRSPNPWPRS